MKKHLILALMMGAMMTPMAANAGMWKDTDTNNDGYISKDESSMFHAKRFDEQDTNKDGKVSTAEMKAYKATHKSKWQEMKNDARATKNEIKANIKNDNVPVQNKMDATVAVDKQPAGYEKQ